jgi:hypothetical protein
MRRTTPLELLRDQQADLEKQAADQRLFMKEVGPFLTSGDEQYVDAERYREILRKLALVKEEIKRLEEPPSDAD